MANDLYSRFTETATRFPDRAAIEVQRREGLDRFSYRRLRSMADAHAAFLASRGVEAGDRCAILAENDTHWCAAYLGMLRHGAVAVPLDTTYSPSQVARLLSDSGARLILTTPRFADVADQARSELARDCPSFRLRETVEHEAQAPPPAAPSAAAPAVILYTSGTTSDPKGVVLTHGNLVSEIDAVFSAVHVDEHDAILGVLPLFHALAQMANLTLPLSVGARVVFLETVNTDELLRALRERGISLLVCVPQFFYLIHQRVFERASAMSWWRRRLFRALLRGAGLLRERARVNLGRRLFQEVHAVFGSRMRLLVSGGSRFDSRIGRDLYCLGFDILQAYGLTETSGGVTVLRPGDPHVESVGQPLPGIELKIVSSGLPGESHGEIAVRGGVVSPGYYRRPDATAASFRDGWLHTGDLGYLDEAGRLYITGRAKEVIVLGSGKNIYPEEIEAHYQQSAFIRELCVMGRARSDAPAAERLHAVVVPDFDVMRERKILNSKEILRFEIESLSAQLPGHHRILSYDVVTEPLPRTTTRKLKRFEIERTVQAGSARDAAAQRRTRAPQAEDDPEWAAGAHAASALQIIRNAADDPGAVRSAANLELDLGLDSMERVELLAELEARFGVDVPDETAHRIYTVRELVEAVRPAAAASGGGGVEVGGAWSRLLDRPADDDPAVASALAPSPVSTGCIFVILKAFYAACRLLLGLRVSGRERLPSQGAFIISPNHQSFLDGFLLAAALPYRVFKEAFFVGDAERFSGTIGSRLARWLHVVPVDPDANLLRAMRAGAQGLRRGKVLILFPEGERSIDGEIKKFKKGAAILSLNVGAPIVPVALDGVFDVWPRGHAPRWSKLLPFSGARMRIHFGPELAPAAECEPTEADHVALTARLRSAVSDLLQQTRAADASP